MSGNKRVVTGIALALMIGACGSRDDRDAGEVAPVRRQESPVPLAERDPVAYRGNVGSAMSEVPPSMQQQFQRLLACTIQKGAKSGKPVVVNADLTRALVAKIKSDRNALLGCE